MDETLLASGSDSSSPTEDDTISPDGATMAAAASSAGAAPSGNVAGDASGGRAASRGSDEARVTLLPGDPRRIGRYVVLSRLGAGGMGVVLSAYDEELDRRVAIKLLRTASDAQSNSLGRTRLLREAQAMARISHPNVIAVYDVGTHDGGVFVAMEFVRGQTLGAWTKSATRTWREVLQPFGQAARGLAAAHGMGLTHRDFKPDNAMIGDDGRVRVLDFGLARTASDEASPEPRDDSAPLDPALEHVRVSHRLTETGAIMGTPAYMPPEQWRGAPVDARSDQYSWCVAVWEALYGQRPHRGDTLGALCKAVLDGEIEAPSRRDIPRFVEVALRRGLSVSPEARFPSMEALLRAIEDDPRIRARRLGLASAAVVMTAVAAASWWSFAPPPPEAPCSSAPARVEAVFGERQRADVRAAFDATNSRFAARAATHAVDELDSTGEAWSAMHREVCLAHRAGEVSDELLDLQMQCLDRRLDEIAAVVSTLIDADDETVARVANVVSSIGPLAACADVTGLRTHTPLPDDPAVREAITTLRAELARVRAEREAGHWAKALELARPLVDRAAAVGWPPIHAEAQFRLADALDWSGDAASALPLYESAAHTALATGDDVLFVDASAQVVWAYGEVLLQAKPALDWAALGEAVLLRMGGEDKLEGILANAIGATLMRAGRYDESIVQYERSLAATSRALGERHPLITRSHVNLGNIHRQRGAYDDALAAYRRGQEIARAGFGETHPQTLRIDGLVLTVLADMGDWERAITEGRALLEMQRAALGVHPDVVITSVHLANALRKGQRHDEALEVLRDAESMLDQLPPETFPDQRVAVTSNIARTLATLGRDEEATTTVVKALSLATELYGEQHPEIAVIWVMAGEIHLTADRWHDAEDAFRRGRDMAIATQAPDHPYVAVAEDHLGVLAARRGDHKQALAHHRRALVILEGHGDDLRAIQEVLAHAAANHLAEGALDEAESAIARALTLEHDDAATHAEAALVGADVAWARKDYVLARERATRGLDAAKRGLEHGSTSESEVDVIAAWLAEHPLP